jgi:HSP20 family protein
MFDYWERDIIPRRNSFRNFFDEMDREFAQAEEMINRVFNTARGIGPSNVDAFRKVSTFPYYYGYQITVGSDGRPHVREFGNVKPGAGGLVEQSSSREPLVDTTIDEKSNTLIITA